MICFLALCGWLVAECGVFQSGCPAAEPCILLQRTTNDESAATADAVVPEDTRLEAAQVVRFAADPAAERTVTLGSTDPNSGFEFELDLTSRGAAIRRAIFSKFDDRDYKDPKPLVVLAPVEDEFSLANREFIFVEQQVQLPLQRLNWTSSGVPKSEDGSQVASFEAVIKIWETNEPVIRLTKTYKISMGSYLLDCDVTVENLSADAQKVRFSLTGALGIGREGFRSDMRKVVGGFRTWSGEIVSSRKELAASFFSKNVGLRDSTAAYQKAQRRGNKAEIEKARKDLRIGRNLPSKYSSAHFLWAAITNKYFAAILRPVPDERKSYCEWVADQTSWLYNPDEDEGANSGDETIGVNLNIAPVSLAAAGLPGSVNTYDFELYIGPKDKSLFDKNELYTSLGFVQTIDFMACCCPAALIRPIAFGILASMKWMYGFIHNYGVVIIILVIVIRIAIHPLTKKSQVSMSKMGKLGPRVEEIKKKYADNKAELNKHLMALYREQGASPIMGMLPMLAQMPILIALWSAIYTSIDLRGAEFLPFWITDLSVPDALIRFATITIPVVGWKVESLNLLPILMGVAMYLQQKLMPSPAAASASPQAAQQQKMMMIMMPIFLPLVLYNGPSGVNLYFMTSTFAGVIEQHVIRRHIQEKEEAESRGLVAATSKTGGKVKKKKPKPFYRFK
jgi:YidC/Oxa1 family membrane protein insertase